MNLFIICIIVRIILVLIAKYANKKTLKILGYITLIPAIGFIIMPLRHLPTKLELYLKTLVLIKQN